MVLGEILLRAATNSSDKVAVIDRSANTSCTYDELNARVNRLAHAFTGAGVRKGDRVAILHHNCLEYIETFFAAMKIGAVLTALDYRAAPRELKYLLNDSEANTLIIGENYLNLIIPILSELGTVKNFISIVRGTKQMISYEKLISSYPSTEPGVNVGENDLATLYYTSGTTGLPKGVMMTHRNLAAALMSMWNPLPVTSDDVTLHTSPFSHIAAVWPLLEHISVGGANVIVEKFDPKVVLEAIEQNGVTTWNSVPAMILRLVEYPDLTKYELGSLRWIGYGASPMPMEVLKRALRLIGNIFVQVYGLTETYIVTLLPKEDHTIGGPRDKLRRLSSCGKALPGMQVRVVNGEGKDIVPGETGEIIVKGDSVTQGYWRSPEETAKAIKQGWFYTGDLAAIDEQGYLYIVDRKKEIIISGGENISPREVEEVIYRHRAVFEAAVIGVPDRQWGEAVKAVVALKEGERVTEEEVISFCKQNLARFKAPKSVDFVESLPKTASGKTCKKELRDRYQADTNRT